MFEEKIQDYIEDRLVGSEKETFEKRLEQEQELRAGYLQELARHTALIAQQRAKDKEALKKVLGQSDLTAQMRTIRLITHISAIAAGILMLFLIGYLLIPKQQSPAQFAMNYFEPYPLSNIRGESTDQQEVMDKALVPYQQGNFGEALPYLRQLQQANPTNSQFKLNLASGLMAEGQPEEAIALLKTISGQSADAAEWYLALAYLQDGQVDVAKGILQEIGGKSHFRKKQAMELREEL